MMLTQITNCTPAWYRYLILLVTSPYKHLREVDINDSLSIGDSMRKVVAQHVILVYLPGEDLSSVDSTLPWE